MLKDGKKEFDSGAYQMNKRHEKDEHKHTQRCYPYGVSLVLEDTASVFPLFLCVFVSFPALRFHWSEGQAA